MHRIERLKEKMNMKSRRRMAVAAGTSCLIIAIVLLMNMLSFNSIDTQARGYAFVENGNTKGTFWYGFTIPNEVKIWQEFNVNVTVDSVKTATSKTYNSNAADNYYKTDLNVSYARGDNFSVKITDHKLKSSSNAWGEDLKSIDDSIIWKDSSNTDCYFTWNPSSPTTNKITYYRIVEQGQNVGKDWGNQLFLYYKDNYDPGPGSKHGIDYKKDPNAIVTNKDTLGRDFKNLADNFLKTQNGFKKVEILIAKDESGNLFFDMFLDYDRIAAQKKRGI